MREILFRGKRADNGEWICGHLLEQHDPVYKAYIVFDFMAEQDNIHTDIMQCDIYEVLPETVGQYTGLTDENGKMIFEGDIVMFSRTRNLPNVTPVPEVVWYHKGDCAFQRFPYNLSLTRGGGGKLLQPDMMWECEVIGNFYDNPELLKGGELNETPH